MGWYGMKRALDACRFDLVTDEWRTESDPERTVVLAARSLDIFATINVNQWAWDELAKPYDRGRTSDMYKRRIMKCVYDATSAQRKEDEMSQGLSSQEITRVLDRVVSELWPQPGKTAEDRLRQFIAEKSEVWPGDMPEDPEGGAGASAEPEPEPDAGAPGDGAEAEDRAPINFGMAESESKSNTAETVGAAV